ncbi:MAG: hypothetical protein QW674_03855 [Candidatus Bathyarchaeia archaeon]
MEEEKNSIFWRDKREFLANIFLVVNPLVWYYTVLLSLQKNLDRISTNELTIFLIWCLHFVGLIFSALICATLTKNIGRDQLLRTWIVLGVFSSLTLSLINTSSFFALSFLSILYGVVLGWGMPACMGHYTEVIPSEKRGRASGLAMLATGIGIVTFGSIEISDAVILGIILAIWRLSSLVALRFFDIKVVPRKTSVSYMSLVKNRSFIIYFIPWVMFSLVNYLSMPLQLGLIVGGEQLVKILLILQNGIMGIAAIAGGFLIDAVGRKRIAIAGFALIGLGSAVLGIYPKHILSWYFSAIMDGVALGFLLVIFVLTIWGDLSFNTPSDKLYALGVTPFFVSKFLELTVGESIVAGIEPYALFSFTAFFLFLAVLPLVYAPETLPEKHIRERELKNYLEKAMREREKYV